MFGWLLLALLVAAGVHVARLPDRRRERGGELVLRYLLAGYCGLPMIAVAAAALAAPDRTAEVLGFPAGNPFQAFLGWAYLGMALTAAMALRLRGAFLVGPAVCWAVFFLGATLIHLHEGHGELVQGGAAGIVATHGLVSVLLLGALAASGSAKPAPAAPS